MYEEGGDARNLLEILERRTEVAENDEERKSLLFRRAKLLSEALSERRRAIEVYETILDIGLEREALTALEALYTSESMWVELIGLYERQLDAKLGERAALHVAIARVASRHQNNVGRAFGRARGRALGRAPARRAPSPSWSVWSTTRPTPSSAPRGGSCSSPCTCCAPISAR